MLAGAALLITALLAKRLAPAGEADLQPAQHWAEPVVSDAVDIRRGAVLIQIRYRVPRPIAPLSSTPCTNWRRRDAVTVPMRGD